MPCFKSAGSTGTLQTPLFPVLAQRHVLVTGSISCVRLACALLSQHKKRGSSRAQTVNIPSLTLYDCRQLWAFPSLLGKLLSSFGQQFFWLLFVVSADQRRPSLFDSLFRGSSGAC